MQYEKAKIAHYATQMFRYHVYKKPLSFEQCLLSILHGLEDTRSTLAGLVCIYCETVHILY